LLPELVVPVALVLVSQSAVLVVLVVPLERQIYRQRSQVILPLHPELVVRPERPVQPVKAAQLVLVVRLLALR
jgi:hypothetical protein